MPGFAIPVGWWIAGAGMLLAIASLAGERKRTCATAQRARRQPTPPPLPATIVVPVKGGDPDLAGNLRSLATQQYPDFELIVAARSPEDIPAGVLPPQARVVYSGDHDPNRSEKINNLLAGVAAARPDCQVLAFADSDGRAGPHWLAGLVEALQQPATGAATGYRLYLPHRGGFWSLLRTAWDAVSFGTLGPTYARFAWGGAMAIRRQDFDRLAIARHWQGTISDDLALSKAVRDAGLKIAFSPHSLVTSEDQTTGWPLLRWVRRQMLIVRVYQPRLWALGFAVHLLYVAAIFAAISMGVHGSAGAWIALATQLALGMRKAQWRLRRARLCLPGYRKWFERFGWAVVALTPLATCLWLAGFLMSSCNTSIEWRGHRYRLRSGQIERL